MFRMIASDIDETSIDEWLKEFLFPGSRATALEIPLRAAYGTLVGQVPSINSRRHNSTP